MNDITKWLAEHGFERFTDVFWENEIDLEALSELTDQHLKEMGLPLGPRVKMLKAIERLALDPPEEPAVAAASLPTEAERRQLTVMFVDMVDSTRLSRELDPEDMRQVLLDYQDAVAGAVSRFDGHIARYLGDGVLCYFGWPRASEIAAERSVHAGLAVTRAVDSLRSATTEPISARVGIATGLVVVGDIIGKGAAEEEAVVGETPNLAARLQGLAQPGQVVVSDTTCRLVDGAFEISALDAVRLKGFTNDVRAFVVSGESKVAIPSTTSLPYRSNESRVEARASEHATQLVGREHELAMIRERWQRAVAGEGQSVLLTGEAGIGKSRIVQAICDALQHEAHYRIRYRSSPFHTDTPLYPSIQHLVSASKFLPEDSNDARVDKLEDILLCKEYVPELVAMVGLDGTARFGKMELPAQRLRNRIMHGLTDETVALSRRRPVLLILEDAHWMDATSLEMTRLLIDKIRNERCLVLIPARPELDAPFVNHPALTRITLNRLGTQQAHEIIRSMARGKSLPEELVEDILAKTDGIPLFVEEVTKSVLESDSVRETDDAFELTVPIDSLAVPATLQDSLMARLDRQQSAKDIAQVAACIGREFATGLLRAISALDEPELKRALDELCEAEVISRRGVEPEVSYRFRHALLCDAAYQSLLKAKRRLIHARIVEFLETDPSTAPEIVAQHAQQAGLQEKAISYLRTAATRALEQSAYAETVAQSAKAIQWVQALPESDAKLTTESRLQNILAFALIPHLGFSATRTKDAVERAVELARQTGHIPQLVSALSGQWLVWMVRGDHANLKSTTDELAHIGEQARDDDVRFWGVMYRGVASLTRGNVEEARLLLREATTLYKPELHERSAVRVGYPLGTCLTWYEGFGAWLVGDVEVAEAIAATIETATKRDDLRLPVFARCWVPAFHSVFALAKQDVKLAVQLARRNLELANEYNMPSYVPWSRYVIAIHEMVDGRIESAREEIAEADTLASELEFEWGLPTFHTEFAKALLTHGRVEEARQFCQQAAEVLTRTKESWWHPELLRTDGDICLAEGKSAEAEAAYLKAIDVAQRQGARSWELRAATSLARLRKNQDDLHGAADALRTILPFFDGGISTPDLTNARELATGLPAFDVQ